MFTYFALIYYVKGFIILNYYEAKFSLPCLALSGIKSRVDVLSLECSVLYSILACAWCFWFGIVGDFVKFGRNILPPSNEFREV